MTPIARSCFRMVPPVSVTVWAVWSRNVSYGYWFITGQCMCWTLGTASYYMIPTLGPNFAFPWLYGDLDTTAAVTFLASDDASFITAATFLVDGGISGAYVTPI